MDNIAISTALPRLREQFGISPAAASWVINAYTLPFSVCMLGAAALAARWGAAPVFRWGSVLFSLASLGCALSSTFPLLVAARFTQGLAAAAIVPLGTALVLDGALSTTQRSRRLGVVATVQGIASVLGPFLGGALVQVSSWRLIFAVNVPLFLCLWLVKTRQQAAQPVDTTATTWRSLTLFLSGLGCCVGGLLQLRPGESVAPAAGLVGCGVLLLGAFLRHDAHCQHPLLPHELRKCRGFHWLSISNLCVTAGLFAAVVCLLQYLQKSYSPLEAGALTLPCTAMPIVAAVFLSRFSGVLCDSSLARMGAFMQTGGFAWVALSIWLDGSYLAALPGLVLAGFGVGVYAPASQGLAFSLAARRLAVGVAAVSTTTKEIGILLGSVLGALLISAFPAVSHAQAGPTHGMPITVGVCAATTLVGLITIPRRRRENSVDDPD